jgi:hypothetical protein
MFIVRMIQNTTTHIKLTTCTNLSVKLPNDTTINGIKIIYSC